MKPINRVFLSFNFLDKDRNKKFLSFLNNHHISFEEIGHSKATKYTDGLDNFSLKESIQSVMSKADYYFVMADRYHSHQQRVDIELDCALYLDVPVIVIQPWSCWSIPQRLKQKARVVFNWNDSSLVETLFTPKTQRSAGRAL